MHMRRHEFRQGDAHFGLGDLAVHMEYVKKDEFAKTLDDTLPTWKFYFTVNLHTVRVKLCELSYT